MTLDQKKKLYRTCKALVIKLVYVCMYILKLIDETALSYLHVKFLLNVLFIVEYLNYQPI